MLLLILKKKKEIDKVNGLKFLHERQKTCFLRDEFIIIFFVFMSNLELFLADKDSG